jgi:hypothetical protein
LDLLAQRRLRHMLPLRRIGKAPFLRHRHKVSELMNLHFSVSAFQDFSVSLFNLHGPVRTFGPYAAFVSFSGFQIFSFCLRRDPPAYAVMRMDEAVAFG